MSNKKDYTIRVDYIQDGSGDDWTNIDLGQMGFDSKEAWDEQNKNEKAQALCIALDEMDGQPYFYPKKVTFIDEDGNEVVDGDFSPQEEQEKPFETVGDLEALGFIIGNCLGAEQLVLPLYSSESAESFLVCCSNDGSKPRKNEKISDCEFWLTHAKEAKRVAVSIQRKITTASDIEALVRIYADK